LDGFPFSFFFFGLCVARQKIFTTSFFKEFQGELQETFILAWLLIIPKWKK